MLMIIPHTCFLNGLLGPVLTVVLVLMVSVSEAVATATTHIWAPSTDVQPFKSWHLTSDLYMPAQMDGSGNRIQTVTNVGLKAGILLFENVDAEIGFDHKSGLGVLDDYPLYGNVKVGVTENAFGDFLPALAVGVFDVGTKADMTDFNILYAKVAKTFAAGDFALGRISLGYFTGNDQLLRDENGVKDNHGPLAAWERTFAESGDRLWLCVEYMGTHSGYGTWNVGASWKFAPNLGVLAGYDMFINTSLANTVTLQVDVDF